MPAERPGERFSTIATKQVVHGDPVVELNHAGVAAKSTQTAPAFPNAANILAARTIGVGEEFVVMMDGSHDVATDLLPGGAAVGDPLWIDPADNSLKAAAGAGLVKFGLIDAIDTTLGIAQVNLEQRGSF